MKQDIITDEEADIEHCETELKRLSGKWFKTSGVRRQIKTLNWLIPKKKKLFEELKEVING